MKFLRVAALLLSCSSFSFGVNKDLIALQRDLEDKIAAVQLDMNNKLSTLTGMVEAMQADSRRTADQVATLQDQVSAAVAKSLGPVNGLSGRVDTVSDDVRALKDSIADLNAQMQRMDAKITDLKNQLQIMQNPPPAPGAATPGGVPGSAGQGNAPVGAPPGMSADKTYTDAVRDLQTGKTDLAYNEFQQYLQYFPNTELAANAQYYLGEIAFNRADYPGAIQSFDSVLERYPENPKTPDAHYMKAMALLKSNQRNSAIQEFRILVQNYPHTDDARKALQELRTLGASSTATKTSTARRR
jgi:tol-pal system protein YbgF